MVGAAFHRRKVPWCTTLLVIGALSCHLLVFVGNTSTARAMEVLGRSTGGWAKVGQGIARSLRIELDYSMEQVSTRLVEGLTHLGFVQRALESVSALLPGNVTLSLGGWGDDQKEQPQVTQEAAAPEAAAEAAQGTVQAAALSLLEQQQRQGQGLENVGFTLEPGAAAGLALVLGEAISETVRALIGQVSKLLHRFLEAVRPALLQVGDWIIRFGDRIQAGITVFSVTLDRAQKLFDQIMSHLAGRGENEGVMLDQAFGLLDASNTGHVTAEDLREVARLYRITALLGKVPEELAEKYDASGDGGLDKEEMALLVDDEALPNLMPVVLRTYSKRLAEVSGHVGAARHRDEVAKAVFEYFALVCSKNATKVSWVADRLGNGSLPVAFTADVIAQACLSEGSPERLTTASVGEILVVGMYELHPNNTVAAITYLANTSFWVSSGLDPSDQPECVGKATAWLANSGAQHVTVEEKPERLGPVATAPGHGADLRAMDMAQLLDFLGSAPQRSAHAGLLEALPGRARELSQQRVAHFLLHRRQERQRHLRDLHSTATQRLGFRGGYGNDDEPDGAPSVSEQTVQSGQLAAPETLEFAAWLAVNASQTAVTLQDVCFQYTSESSNVLDSVGSEIQTLVSRVQAFLDTLMKFSTPSGLKRLEAQIVEWEERAMTELAGTMQEKLVSLMNTSFSSLESIIAHAAFKTGRWVGQRVGNLLEKPLGQMVADPLMGYAAKLVEGDSGKMIAELLGPDLARSVANLTSGVLAETMGQVMEVLVEKSLEQAVDMANSSISKALGDLLKGITQQGPRQGPGEGKEQGREQGRGVFPFPFPLPGLHLQQQEGPLESRLLQLGETASRATVSAWELSSTHSWDSGDLVATDALTLEVMKAQYADKLEAGDGLGSTWSNLVDTVETLVEAFTAAVRSAKDARKEVSRVSSSADSIFTVLDQRGQRLFDTVAHFWERLWLLYFCSLVPLHLYLLFYAFWAGGFFGGPSPLPQELEKDMEPPSTNWERLQVCYESASLCMKKYHDTELCFWSVVVLLQLVILVLFIVSIGLSAFAGIKAFLVAGCTQVYVLGDDAVCREQMATLREFLSTFFVAEALEPLQNVCGRNQLVTCSLIQKKLLMSGIMTSACSLIAVLVSLHLIVDSAVLHEQARWRRLAAALLRDRAQEAADAARAGAAKVEVSTEAEVEEEAQAAQAAQAAAGVETELDLDAQRPP